MKVAYLIEYRNPPVDGSKRSPKWLAVGVVSAPPALDVSSVIDRVRAEYPSFDGYEIRVRYFHPMPGCRVEGSQCNVLVIDTAVAPIVQQTNSDESCPCCDDIYAFPPIKYETDHDGYPLDR